MRYHRIHGYAIAEYRRACVCARMGLMCVCVRAREGMCMDARECEHAPAFCANAYAHAYAFRGGTSFTKCVCASAMPRSLRYVRICVCVCVCVCVCACGFHSHACLCARTAIPCLWALSERWERGACCVLSAACCLHVPVRTQARWSVRVRPISPKQAC